VATNFKYFLKTTLFTVEYLWHLALYVSADIIRQ